MVPGQGNIFQTLLQTPPGYSILHRHLSCYHACGYDKANICIGFMYPCLLIWTNESNLFSDVKVLARSEWLFFLWEILSQSVKRIIIDFWSSAPLRIILHDIEKHPLIICSWCNAINPFRSPELTPNLLFQVISCDTSLLRIYFYCHKIQYMVLVTKQNTIIGILTDCEALSHSSRNAQLCDLCYV